MDRASAPRSGIAHAAHLICAVAVVLSTASCGPPVADSPRTWVYGPGTMRIHPITRIAPTTSVSAGQVQVRVEFTDEDGFTTRAMGRLTATLEVAGREPQSVSADLGNREANRAAWDAATRTYLLSIVPGAPIPKGSAVTVRVQWDRVDGRVQRDSMTLTAP
jgi:hypothetical protein